MSLLFVLATASFFIWMVRNTLFWVYLWQLKEYRLDRMMAHLLETQQGGSLFFSFRSLLKLVVLLSYAAVIYKKEFLLPYQLFTTFVLVLEAYFALKEVRLETLKRPTVTVKAILLFFLTLATVSALFAVSLFERFFWLMFLDRATAVITSFFVLLFMFPTEIYWDVQIEKAIQKLKKHRRRLLVIGVTGSYGKSSTKEYIAQVLQHKYRVLRTQGTNNTPIGIAKTVLTGLRNDTQILVVEMGAYKKKEIAQLCQIVQPRIGVVTSVSDQHLSLFGSLKNTIGAKYELVESLPNSGLVLFNGNNENTRKLYERAKKKKVLYQTFTQAPLHPAAIAAYNVRAGKTSVHFDVMFRRTTMHLVASLIGEQSVENVLPAIYLANYVGMRKEQIQDAVATLVPLARTMTKHVLENGASAIDDTFSANPNAALAAISYMRKYEGEKVLVLSPLIELGKKGEYHHYTIGKRASLVCDYLFVTNSNFFSYILNGIKDGRRACLVKVAGASEIVAFVQENMGKGDVVVFEGREAAAPLTKLL